MREKIFNAPLSHIAQMMDAFAHAAFAQYELALLKPLKFSTLGSVHDHRPILAKKFRVVEQRMIGHGLASVDRIENSVAVPTFEIGQNPVFDFFLIEISGNSR